MSEDKINVAEQLRDILKTLGEYCTTAESKEEVEKALRRIDAVEAKYAKEFRKIEEIRREILAKQQENSETS